MNNVLKKAQPFTPNINSEEKKAMKVLRNDDTRVAMITDKGVAIVVMDKDDYIKTEDLLNQPTYKIIPAAHTTRQKNKVINLLKNIKAEGGISEEPYKKTYPSGAGSPKFYGLPMIHNQWHPWDP